MVVVVAFLAAAAKEEEEEEEVGGIVARCLERNCLGRFGRKWPKYFIEWQEQLNDTEM